jgi:hypothetical protein
MTGQQYSISSIDSEISNDGIVLDNVLIKSAGVVGNLNLVNRVLKDNILESSTVINASNLFIFTLEKNIYSEYFDIVNNQLIAKTGYPTDRVIYLDITCQLNSEEISKDKNLAQYLDGWKDYITVNKGQFSDTIAVVDFAYFNATDSSGRLINLTTDFWKHGKSGIIDIQEKLKPCFWYGKQHPFEFEFVVNDNPGVHKIFENLNIISNKAKPESFHYEITGEVYKFSDDKKNMYYRQEATKELYQNLGSDIIFNREYKETPIEQNLISTVFPWYYERIDTFDYIYDKYQQKQSAFNKDYQNLTGSEIVYDSNLEEYNIVTHCKGADLTEVGRIRGNMQYKEDVWDVEIRPINYMQKNETK